MSIRAKTKKKDSGGRPSKYDPKFCQKIIEYFSVQPYKTVKKKVGNKETEKVVVSDFPSLAGFAVSIGIHRDTLHQWTKTHKEFSDAVSIAKSFQENWLLVNGMASRINTSFALMGMKNLHDWSDKVENKSTVEIDNLIFDDENE